MTKNWADTDLHQVKRSLSAYEKRSLTGTPLVTGRAVVLPGAPNTEIEELLTVGFDPCRIYGVEEVPDIAESLYEHYYDAVNIHWDNVTTFLTRSRGLFSYIHLDFCGHFLDEELAAFETAFTRVEPHARVRLSLYRSRKMDEQRQREQLLFDKCVESLLSVIDERYPVAQELLRELKHAGDDISIVVTALALLNATFGIRAYNYTDEVTSLGRSVLPDSLGTHRINSVRRFTYNEAHTASQMVTLWFDLVPLYPSVVSSSEDWKKQEILQVLGMVQYPPTPYNNPALFE